MPHAPGGALRATWHLLQPVLLDWDSSDAPPFSALIRPESKQDAVVQDFVGFLAGLLQIATGTLGLGKLVRLVPVSVVLGSITNVGKPGYTVKSFAGL